MVEDIYGDLDNFNLDQQLQQVQQQNNELQHIIEKLEESTQKFHIEITEIKNINKNLEVNISALYKTAKCEIDRKDKQIVDLRRELDNVKFRRGKPKGINIENGLQSIENLTKEFEKAKCTIEQKNRIILSLTKELENVKKEFITKNNTLKRNISQTEEDCDIRDMLAKKQKIEHKLQELKKETLVNRYKIQAKALDNNRFRSRSRSRSIDIRFDSYRGRPNFKSGFQKKKITFRRNRSGSYERRRANIIDKYNQFGQNEHENSRRSRSRSKSPLLHNKKHSIHNNDNKTNISDIQNKCKNDNLSKLRSRSRSPSIDDKKYSKHINDISNKQIDQEKSLKVNKKYKSDIHHSRYFTSNIDGQSKEDSESAIISSKFIELFGDREEPTYQKETLRKTKVIVSNNLEEGELNSSLDDDNDKNLPNKIIEKDKNNKGQHTTKYPLKLKNTDIVQSKQKVQKTEPYKSKSERSFNINIKQQQEINPIKSTSISKSNTLALHVKNNVLNNKSKLDKNKKEVTKHSINNNLEKSDPIKCSTEISRTSQAEDNIKENEVTQRNNNLEKSDSIKCSIEISRTSKAEDNIKEYKVTQGNNLEKSDPIKCSTGISRTSQSKDNIKENEVTQENNNLEKSDPIKCSTEISRTSRAKDNIKENEVTQRNNNLEKSDPMKCSIEISRTSQVEDNIKEYKVTQGNNLEKSDPIKCSTGISRTSQAEDNIKEYKATQGNNSEKSDPIKCSTGISRTSQAKDNIKENEVTQGNNNLEKSDPMKCSIEISRTSQPEDNIKETEVTQGNNKLEKSDPIKCSIQISRTSQAADNIKETEVTQDNNNLEKSDPIKCSTEISRTTQAADNIKDNEVTQGLIANEKSEMIQIENLPTPCVLISETIKDTEISLHKHDLLLEDDIMKAAKKKRRKMDKERLLLLQSAISKYKQNIQFLENNIYSDSEDEELSEIEKNKIDNIYDTTNEQQDGLNLKITKSTLIQNKSDLKTDENIGSVSNIENDSSDNNKVNNSNSSVNDKLFQSKEITKKHKKSVERKRSSDFSINAILTNEFSETKKEHFTNSEETLNKIESTSNSSGGKEKLPNIENSILTSAKTSKPNLIKKQYSKIIVSASTLVDLKIKIDASNIVKNTSNSNIIKEIDSKKKCAKLENACEPSSKTLVTSTNVSIVDIKVETNASKVKNISNSNIIKEIKPIKKCTKLEKISNIEPSSKILVTTSTVKSKVEANTSNIVKNISKSNVKKEIKPIKEYATNMNTEIINKNNTNAKNLTRRNSKTEQSQRSEKNETIKVVNPPQLSETAEKTEVVIAETPKIVRKPPLRGRRRVYISIT